MQGPRIRNITYFPLPKLEIRKWGGRMASAFFAILYGLFFAGLPLLAFKDRGNYLDYTTLSDIRLSDWLTQGILTTLSNEPVWLLINMGLSQFLAPEEVLRAIIFFPAVTVAYLALRADPKNAIWIILFLFLPQVIKNHIIHLRQGLAIAVFLLGWFNTNRNVRWFFIFLTPFIHASFFFIIMLIILINISKKLRLAPDLRSLLFVGAGTAVGMNLGYLAMIFGSRKAQEYAFTAADISGLGFIFWAGIAILMALEGKNFFRQYTFPYAIILFYLATYFLVEVSARIFENGLLLVLLAGLQMRSWRKGLFITEILGYGILQWLLRFGMSKLGFGLG